MVPWKEVATTMRGSIETISSRSGGAANDENGVNLCMLIMKWVGTQKDCPTEFQAQANKLETDGVWGLVAQETYKLLKRLAAP